MENEISIFRQIPYSKQEQSDWAQRAVASVLDGELNPLDTVVKVSALSEALTLFLKDKGLKEAVIDEIEKYDKRERIVRYGATVQKKEVGTRYDFSACGDPQLDELNRQLDELQTRIKDREKYLKALSAPKTELDEETGEVYKVSPPARTSTTTYVITFKKQ